MIGLLARHGVIAICLAVMIEELGIPSPIPTDILIVMAGAGGGTWARFALSFVLISLSSAIGASGLYAAVRRGGRPLVDRFGRYIHLGPTALARGEALLARSGWFGIAVGRATPGLRLPTVIVCGLLGVSYRRFISAHVTGTAIYILAFLLLGRAFGPRVLDLIHLPRVSVQLVALLILAIGLPGLLFWLASHDHINREDDIPAGRHLAIGAAIGAALAGSATFAAAWSAGVALADLADEPPPLLAGYRLLRPLLGRSQSTYILAYVLLTVIGIALGAIFLELVLPLLARRLRSLRLQSLTLAALTFTACALLGLLAPPPPGPARHIPTNLILLLGSIAYAITTVHARALALALLPTGRERPPRAPEPAPHSGPPAP